MEAFLKWGSFLSSDSTLYQININLSNTTLLQPFIILIKHDFFIYCVRWIPGSIICCYKYGYKDYPSHCPIVDFSDDITETCPGIEPSGMQDTCWRMRVHPVLALSLLYFLAFPRKINFLIGNWVFNVVFFWLLTYCIMVFWFRGRLV